MGVPERSISKSPTGNNKTSRIIINPLPKRLVVEAKNIPSEEKYLRLAYQLHTTLNIPRMIELFYTELKNKTTIVGVHYQFDRYSLNVPIGEKTNYQIQYRLRFEEENLGIITFFSTEHFLEEYLVALESWVCLLVAPLHNAIDYHRALESAVRDPLTGLLNRTALQNTLNREVELAKRYKTALSLLALDIDHFKTINDTHGHLAGDELLKVFAQVLRRSVRNSDLIFRIGGEEFIVLLSNTHLKGAFQLAERIRARIEHLMCEYQGTTIPLRTSVGVASYTDGESEENLLEKADKALYRAKSAGRNCVKE